MSIAAQAGECSCCGERVERAAIQLSALYQCLHGGEQRLLARGDDALRSDLRQTLYQSASPAAARVVHHRAVSNVQSQTLCCTSTGRTSTPCPSRVLHELCGRIESHRLAVEQRRRK
jgi:hypothetical protein